MPKFCFLSLGNGVKHAIFEWINLIPKGKELILGNIFQFL